jgi:hypothetical protein
MPKMLEMRVILHYLLINSLQVGINPRLLWKWFRIHLAIPRNLAWIQIHTNMEDIEWWMKNQITCSKCVCCFVKDSAYLVGFWISLVIMSYTYVDFMALFTSIFAHTPSVGMLCLKFDTVFEMKGHTSDGFSLSLKLRGTYKFSLLQLPTCWFSSRMIG